MEILSVKILVMLMFGLFLASAISMLIVLFKWLATEKDLPKSTRVLVTFIPVLIFCSFAHQTGNQQEVKQRALFSVLSFAGGLLIYFYLQWAKGHA